MGQWFPALLASVAPAEKPSKKSLLGIDVRAVGIIFFTTEGAQSVQRVNVIKMEGGVRHVRTITDTETNQLDEASCLGLV
jgi:hypothetical protein